MKTHTVLDRQSGLGLLELLVAMALAAVLLLGLVQLITAAGSATRLQDNQAAMQDTIRYTGRLLANTVSRAGFTPQPWNRQFDLPAVAPGTSNGADSASDRLAVQDWSDLNCFENRNSATDSDGQPLFFVRETEFDLNGSGYLTRTCRYGPSRPELVTQVRRQGLVPGVESFQLLFGDDRDGDGNIDRWVRAGEWSDEGSVLGIRAGVLLAGPDAVTRPAARSFSILGANIPGDDDGKLRKAVEFTIALRGRQP